MKRLALYALVLYVLSIFLETILLGDVLGSVSRWACYLAIGLCAAYTFSRANLVKPDIAHVLMFLFLCFNLISVFWSLDPDATAGKLFSYSLQLGIVAVILQLVETADNSTRVIGAYVVASASAAAYTLRMFQLTAGAVDKTRYTVADADPNELALSLALAIPLAWYLGLTVRNPLLRIWFRLCPFALAAAIVLTGSRGGALALLASLLVIPLCRKQAGRFATSLAIVFLICIAVAGATFVPGATVKRLTTIGDQVKGGDLAGRRAIWAAGWTQFLDHPAVGVGAGAFPTAVSIAGPNMTAVAHNTFLSIMTELGVTGFTIYLALLGRLLYLALRMPKPERFVWLIMLLTWGIGVSALTWEQSRPTWLVFALLLAQARQSAMGREADAPEFPVLPTQPATGLRS